MAVTVNDRSGTISGFRFGGTEFFALGAWVSDFGFQIGTDTATFAKATATGGLVGMAAPSMSSDGGRITASGTYRGLSFTRSYEILADDPVLKIETIFRNPTGSSVSLRAFENTDPDQQGFSTRNDVISVDGHAATLASAASGLSVVMGTAPGQVATVRDFSVDNGHELNAFFGPAIDPNGAHGDTGHIIGLDLAVGAGSSAGYTSYYAAGYSASAAAGAFADALASAEVPLPAALPMLLVGLGGLAAAKSRLRMTDARSATPPLSARRKDSGPGAGAPRLKAAE
ncbi:VPLPA-CTERM sorting domain-containing protein [Mangrovicoccus ximenensis]|uniref:VPLPA-CTERM sorting domain-containing protein n=1 Tax=Mangrovicoccus ximenensis TaxID=1911570 RepID=UPI000D346BDA|nr:VPLPA-CTERM sorting domain-containing protein [Mangrovicoccus ximenensis]